PAATTTPRRTPSGRGEWDEVSLLANTYLQPLGGLENLDDSLRGRVRGWRRGSGELLPYPLLFKACFGLLHHLPKPVVQSALKHPGRDEQPDHAEVNLEGDVQGGPRAVRRLLEPVFRRPLLEAAGNLPLSDPACFHGEFHDLLVFGAPVHRPKLDLGRI